MSLRGDGVSSYAGCHNDAEAPIATTNNGVFFLNSQLRLEDELLDGRRVARSRRCALAERGQPLRSQKLRQGDLAWLRVGAALDGAQHVREMGLGFALGMEATLASLSALTLRTAHEPVASPCVVAPTNRTSHLASPS